MAAKLYQGRLPLFSMHPDEREARLIVASLGPKFKGRDKLVQYARMGDDSAFLALEMPPRQRELMARAGRLTLQVLVALGSVYTDIEKRRGELQERRGAVPEDPVERRRPGNVAERYPRLALEAALRQAGFRTATHDHKTTISVVQPGEEGVRTESGHTKPTWMSSAYQKKAFKVATSRHHWKVSTRIGRVRKKWDGKYLWLTPTLRVRQGRGTSLVVERHHDDPGGYRHGWEEES